MTSSHNRGPLKAPLCAASAERGQAGADRNRRPAIRLSRAVLGERPLDLALRTVDTHGPRHAAHERLCRSEHVRTAARQADPWVAESALQTLNRREHRRLRVSSEEELRRCPGRQVENVLQRAPLLDVDGEIRRPLDEGQPGRRPGEGGANALDRIGVGLLRAGRRDRTGDQQTHQSRGTQAHGVRTLPARVQLVAAQKHIRCGRP